MGAGDVFEVTVHGSNGDCTGPLAIPTDAVAVALNVTAVNATATSNIRVYPANLTEVPTLSNLNVTAGAPPTPNKVDVQLSPDGKIRVYNFRGTVNIFIDVVGYYTNSTLKELAAGLAAANAKIAALDAAQPFTVVSDPIFSVLAQSAATEIRSVEVTAPVDGQVAIFATGYMAEVTDGQIVVCKLLDSEADPMFGEELAWQSPTGGDFANLSGSRAFDLAAGQTATYSLICNNTNGGDSDIVTPRVVAIFTPAP